MERHGNLPVTRRQVINGRPVGYRPGTYTYIPRGTPEVIIASTLADLQRIIRRGVKRGEFGEVGQYARTAPNEYRVAVLRIKPAPPRWRKPLIIAGSVVGAAGALFGIGYALLIAIGSALTGAGSTMVGALVVIALAALVLTPSGRRVVEVVVRIKD